jgi:DNA invertase Pin-like site-specific DNA recombinase
MTPALAYSYLRFSHPDQAKGDSQRRQTELRDAWLARHPKVRLVTGLTLEDKGVSGYTGRHRDNPDRHALAAFLALVEAGRIVRGSYLIVENLDRLSREDIIPALSLLLDLIQNGIRVVQLLPVETVYDAQSNPMHLMMAIMELSRGHSESAMKSERVGGAWRQKKRRAAESGEPLTARAPAWLRLAGGKWEVVAEAAEAVRRIYRMATDGYGISVITKKLNADKTPTISTGQRAGKHWPRSYVANLLRNRAVVGEYQPHAGRGTKRHPDGRPIAGYFPAIVTDEEWYAARAALVARREKPGRLPEGHINVFAGLLFDARDGGSLHQVNKGPRGGGRLLVPYKAIQGAEGSRYASFPFGTFERAVLSCLREIDPRDILPNESGGEDRSLVLTGRLAEINAEIEKVKNRLQAKYSDAVADVLERHEAERAALEEQLAEARQAEASPLDAAWRDCGSLLDVLDGAERQPGKGRKRSARPDAEEARVRLRAALRRVVEGVWCLLLGRGKLRVAAVQFWFTGGAHRDYLIVHQAATGGSVGVRSARWWVRSLKQASASANFDLRKPEDARELEAELAAADLRDDGAED